MKDKNQSGNLFSDAATQKFEFDNEFDSELIANRGEGVDALSEDDFVEKGFKKKDSVFTKEDIKDIASQSSEAKKAADLYKQLTDDEETESALIKSEDAEKMEDIKSLYDDSHGTELIIKEDEPYPEEFDDNDETKSEVYDEESDDLPESEYEDYESVKHLLTDEEKEKYEKRKNKTVKKIRPEDIQKKKILEQAKFEKKLFQSIYSDEYKESDEYRDMIMLEKQFEDIVKAPRIDMKINASLESNLLETDEIKNNKKFVEITHAPNPDNPDDTHQMSTVEINRDENGEIENIVVICKCGEKTLIKFDYQDEYQNASDSEIPEEFNKTDEADDNDIPEDAFDTDEQNETEEEKDDEDIEKYDFEDDSENTIEIDGNFEDLDNAADDINNKNEDEKTD